RREERQQQRDQRRLPCEIEVKAQRDRIGVARREREQEQKDRQPDDPGQHSHSAGSSSGTPFARNARYGCAVLGCALAACPAGTSVPSTRSRNSLPALKCGTYFSGTCTFSPDFGLRPTRGGR